MQRAVFIGYRHHLRKMLMNRQQQLDIRLADNSDLTVLIELDEYASLNPSRKKVIANAISAEQCWVGELADEIAGYIILTQDFYENDFIKLIIVKLKYRRTGVAYKLISFIETQCKTKRLFTSCEATNIIAQQLFLDNAFQPSGAILNINEMDTEVVFFKELS